MITELNEKAIAVEVPEGAHTFSIGFATGRLCYSPKGSAINTIYTDLPPGNWSILGRPNELSEEQWKKVVTAEKTFGYPSYGQIPNGSYQWFAKPSESGQSLLKSKNVNPESVIILIKQ